MAGTTAATRPFLNLPNCVLTLWYVRVCLGSNSSVCGMGSLSQLLVPLISSAKSRCRERRHPEIVLMEV